MYTGEYSFLSQSKVVFGEKAADAVAEEVSSRGALRVLLVSSKSLNRKLGATQAVIECLAESLVGVFDEIEPHAPLTSVVNLLEMLKSTEPDLIVSMGGGSVIDTVKVSLLAYASGVNTAAEITELRVGVDAVGNLAPPKGPETLLRQVAVPTTLSGAEWGTIGGAVDPERNIKDLYSHPQLCSDTIIYDPELCRFTPNELWLSTAFRAIDHSIETILSRQAQPFTDGSAIHSLRLFAGSLDTSPQGEKSLQSLQDSQFAVWLATVGLMRTPYGASHGIGHQLGAIAGVPHGLCSSIMLPAVLRYNAEAAGERDGWIASALGYPENTASDACRQLARKLKLTDNLKDAGVDRADLRAIAEASVGSYFVRNNLRLVDSADQVMEILEMAWQ